jgi:MYXO-CTERM domain-containing protein
MVCRSSLALAICLLFAGTVHAGPVELFHDIHIESGKPDTLVLEYMYGQGGLFLSSDGGAHFQLMCSGAIDKSLQRDGSVFYVTPGDAMYLGAFGGLWRGTSSGCGWQEVTALHEKWVARFAGDPVDPKLTYLITSTGSGAKNGLYVNDGKSADWNAFGSQEELFLDTLHIVKLPAGKRFYETAVRPPKPDATADDVPEYLVRVSDDEGKTWTDNAFGNADQYGPKDTFAEMQIMAVDPTNPDHVVARVVRSMDVDDLLYSPSQGKAGTWTKLAQVGKLEAIAFKPDGTLFYGDNDQESPGLFTISKLGENAKQLSMGWKVGCLKYDVDRGRMFACNDWQFGTANLDSGAFMPMLDMRTAEKFVECAGEQPMAGRCQQQLLQGYCGPAHYEYAPVCTAYDRPWLEPLGGAGGASGSSAGAGGMSSSAGSTASAGKDAAGESAAGKAGAPAGSAGQAAGARAAAGSGGSSGGDSKSGCSCSAPGTTRSALDDGFSAGLGALFVGLALLRRRRA